MKASVRTVVEARVETVSPSSLNEQSAQPGRVQPSKSEAPETQSAVVEVQPESSQQLDDGGPVSTLHAHRQSSAKVLLLGSSAQQQLHQLQRSSTLTDLDTAQEEHTALYL